MTYLKILVLLAAGLTTANAGANGSSLHNPGIPTHRTAACDECVAKMEPIANKAELDCFEMGGDFNQCEAERANVMGQCTEVCTKK